VLNDVTRAFVEAHADRADLAVHHVAGERFVEGLRERADVGGGGDGILYHVIGYEDRMPQAYAAADLVLARAGASTVAELAAVGVPSILVPWPGAAEDHQTDNALALSERGAAILLPEPRLSAERLASELASLRDAPDRLEAMAAAARAAGEIHRSGRLAELIDEVAGP
jgi:UDP-N-acetylglucosamine--N-acetylmuramyl-(pentapeptide) pyrophosphoryl-undecaprenol N-acetylglucosamine transferase